MTNLRRGMTITVRLYGTGEKLFLNRCRRQSEEKKEVRDTVINKLRIQQHKDTTKNLAIVARSKNKKKLWPIALVNLPGIPLCIVCVRCLCNFARVLPLYILLSLELRGNGRTFLISRSG